jgi:hypothetical protein
MTDDFGRTYAMPAGHTDETFFSAFAFTLITGGMFAAASPDVSGHPGKLGVDQGADFERGNPT